MFFVTRPSRRYMLANTYTGDALRRKQRGVTCWLGRLADVVAPGEAPAYAAQAHAHCLWHKTLRSVFIDFSLQRVLV